ncbi:MAG TPA: hypothetical protein VIJ16_08360, partial [Gemmatimonadaceae bacterium]
ACVRNPGRAEPAQPPVVVEVNNRGFFDVDLFVENAPNSAGVRLATVGGFMKTHVSVPVRELQSGGLLALRVRVISSSRYWDSPGISVGPGQHVALDIYTDANGNLNRSTLYPINEMDTLNDIRDRELP